MTPGPPPPKRPPEREYTQKIRYCKGCHNEIHRDVPRCLVCGTRNIPTDQLPAMEDPLAPRAPTSPPGSPASPAPAPPAPETPATEPAPEPTKK